MKLYKIIAVGLVILASCGPKTILQTDTGSAIDLSGRWNNTDAEIATNQIFNDLQQSDWFKQYSAGINYTPSILVEYFTNDMDNDLYNEQIVNYFSQYIKDSRQFKLLKEDNTEIPYLILKGELSSENFEINDQNGINYHLEVTLLSTEGSVLWSNDNYIKKFLKE